LSIIKHVTLQKIVAQDFRYDLRSSSLVCRATGSLSCCYPFVISDCILHHTRIQTACCLLPSFYRLIKLAENVVIKELLENTFSVLPLQDKVRRVNKGRLTPPIPNVITHYKSNTERCTDIFASLSMTANFIVGSVYFFLTNMKSFQDLNHVKCAVKKLKITNSCAPMCTVKIIWTTTKG